MDQWTEIRRRALVDGLSMRQLQREFHLHWKTLRKILDHPEPPGYRQAAVAGVDAEHAWQWAGWMTGGNGAGVVARHSPRTKTAVSKIATGSGEFVKDRSQSFIGSTSGLIVRAHRAGETAPSGGNAG